MRCSCSTRDRDKVAILQREYKLRQGVNRSHPCKRGNPDKPMADKGQGGLPLKIQRLVIHIHIVMPAWRHHWLLLFRQLRNERLGGEQ